MVQAKTIFLLSILILSLPLLAQNPNKQELQSAPEVEFFNFSGRHRQIDSRDSIYKIGVYLSEKIEQQQSNYYNKYKITRSISKGDESLFDADILTLESSAGVDHIRNLRLIIAGYLSTQYGIDAANATTLATFASYYNVHYRNNISYFASKYKPAVLKLLSNDKVGLSKDYRQWPGATQLLIPLSSDKLLGIAPSPDLAETGQAKVVDDMMDDDAEEALPLREDMVEQRKEELQQKQKTLDQLKTKQQQQQQQTEVDKKQLNGIIQQSNSSKERTKAEQQLEQAKTAEQKQQQQQQQIKSKQQQLAQQKDSLNKEESGIQQDRQALSKDNQPLYFPLLATILNGDNQLVSINLTAATISATSELKDLRSASLLITNTYLYVISGKPKARLTRLTSGNLKVDKFSIEEVFPAAPIWQFEGLEGLFTLIAAASGQEGNWLLAHYDEQLTLLSQSELTVLPHTSLQYAAGQLLLQNSKGLVVSLNSDTLQLQKIIK